MVLVYRYSLKQPKIFFEIFFRIQISCEIVFLKFFPFLCGQFNMFKHYYFQKN